jgi:hypothetical protein
MAAKKDGGFYNEGHDDSSINDGPKLSKGEIQFVGSTAPLVDQVVSVNQKTGHAGNGEE